MLDPFVAWSPAQADATPIDNGRKVDGAIKRLMGLDAQCSQLAPALMEPLFVLG
jgi:hypothetical protein